MALIYDGYSTVVIVNVANPIIFALSEKMVTPLALKGGGGIDSTDMKTRRMRTQVPKALIGADPMKYTVYYDPAVLPQILNNFQLNVAMLIRFPNGSGWSFYGWLDEFDPSENKEGENPTAVVTLVPSFQNGTTILTSGGSNRFSSSGAENAPSYIPANPGIQLPARPVLAFP
jgi:hypothetical protein